jgi:hypothetical protein
MPVGYIGHVLSSRFQRRLVHVDWFYCLMRIVLDDVEELSDRGGYRYFNSFI